MAAQAIRVEVGTPVEVRGDEASATVFLSVGEVRLSFTEDAAHDLLDAVRRELNALDPFGYDCADCQDTGDRWVGIARGAVSRRACHCPAARR
ncbi:hypothetical protein [Saccharothrix coeruleofusca]|uniref:Uncharacterized protein n=1 Tax=Saccharothrix coeruleofusca TaxID=33919 RepID=A0A918EG94_9PSEU|nr:hypothetical protein [Saccharothrix coeruleofusca]MBP2339121.1 hypothetical protein [Saccharothrix coeruleofusca]GGP70076.1 hypothetical protein GCM10010185_48850 [Saccharothrix coeruleofusca]